jgi:uncharacterized protein
MELVIAREGERMDLLPPEAFSKHRENLRVRLGDAAFEKRLAREQTLNPANGTPIALGMKIFTHNCIYAFITATLTLSGKYSKARNNCNHPILQEHAFTGNKLPQGRSLRILQLSDLHLDTNPELVHAWVEIIRDLEYDLAVITGDFLNAYQLPSQALMGKLRNLISHLHAPIFGILGNHDVMMLVPTMEALGVRMLLNESISISLHGLKLLITGLDDPHQFRSDDLQHATWDQDPKRIKPDFALMLNHAPTLIPEVASMGYDLMLSGHTHGGQLCTLGGVPLLRNGRYPREYLSGRWSHGSLQGYTSPGSGTGRLHFRLNCPPEITLHTIQG